MTFDVINVCIITLVFQWKNTLFCQLFSDLFFKRSKRDSNDTNLTYAHRRLINKFMKLILHLFACIATNPYTNSLTSRESPPIDAANKRFATQYKPNVIWTVRERTTCTRVVTQFQICSAWFAFFFSCVHSFFCCTFLPFCCFIQQPYKTTSTSSSLSFTTFSRAHRV